jgi:hypothetical protein
MLKVFNNNIILPKYLKKVKQKGSSLSLPAYGREGQGQHLFSWRGILQSEIRNSAAAESGAASAPLSFPQQ